VLGLGDAGALAEALGVVGDPGVVLVDDAEGIDGTPVEPVLADLLGDATAGKCARLVLAGTTTDLAGRFRGVVAEARRSRTGVLLAPTGYADGDVLGVVVARASSARPGRGVLVRRGEVTAVQVATPGG
jgi:S-DNA-T family DNA segregation ATPase FtsK/SpoIIIE